MEEKAATKSRVKSGVKSPKKPMEKTDRLCPVASKCGGCRWINRTYEEQLQNKSTAFRKLMEPYGKPEPIIGMEKPEHYRNKVHAVFGEDRRHRIISGIYEEKSHKIVPVDKCLIENEKADEIIVSIRELLPSFKIRPYNEDTGYGLLRHVLIRTGHITGQIMVVLVLSSPIMPSKNNFVKALLKKHPEITTIVLNVNDRNTSMVLGNKEHVLYGKGYIEDELRGIRFPLCFPPTGIPGFPLLLLFPLLPRIHRGKGKIPENTSFLRLPPLPPPASIFPFFWQRGKRAEAQREPVLLLRRKKGFCFWGLF